MSLRNNTLITLSLLLLILISLGCSAGSRTIRRESEPATETEPESGILPYDEQALDHVIVASIYETEGDYLRALHEYNKAILEDSSSVTLYIKAAENYQRLGELDSARLLLEKARRQLGDQPEILRFLGELEYQLERFDRALQIFQNLVQIVPDDSDAWYNLGSLYLKNGDHEKAVQCYDEVQRIKGPDFDLLVRQATIYSMEKEYDKSLRYYERMRSLQPDDSQVPFSMGGMYLQMGDTTRSDSMFSLVTEMDPKVSRYWVVRIQLAAIRGKDNEVPQLLEAALKYNPQNLELLSLAGSYYMSVKEYPTAEKYIKQAASLDSTGIEFLVNLGFLYHELKEWKKAEESYLEAMKIKPDDALLLNNYAYMLAESGERLDRALALVDSALSLQPDTPSFLDTKGWILYKLNDYEDARKYLEKASQNNPENPEIYEHLGDLYRAMGENALAREAWEHALDAGEENARIRQKIESSP